MKAVILSISTGQGHHATGKAVSDIFEQMQVPCTTIDAYEQIDHKLSAVVSKGYLLSASHAKRLSSVLYNMLVKRDSPASKYSVSTMTNTYFAWDLKREIQRINPDIIVCTHVLSSILASLMKKHTWTSAVCAGIVTDFTVHPLWEETGDLDYYVIPNELLEFQMIRKGLKPEKLLPFGIPIKPQFANNVDKSLARRALGLDERKPTLLLMSGSMGFGNIDVSIKKLDSLPFDFQVMVVCGNNKSMYDKIIKGHYSKRFDIYGYVDNVDQMMDAADCIITKPGGITSSEALAKGLPMIMVNPIPGHETRNAEFMLNNGIALYATSSFPLEEAVFSLFRHPNRLKDLQLTIKPYAKANAAEDLCRFLIRQTPVNQGDGSTVMQE